MKDIYNYITENFNNENIINEWKQDLMPQCIVVIGGPGAGKTYWMDHYAHEFFKKNNNANINLAFKRLDSDNNLRKYQLLHVDEFVEGIILSCAGDAIVGDDIRSPRAAFNKYIESKQAEMDEKCAAGGSKTIDLSVIDWSFCKGFINRYDHAESKRISQQKIIDEFKDKFKEKYFDALFASDFSVRKLSKAEYKKDFNDKLKGEIDGLEFVGPSDVVIAITGDKLEKFEEIVDVCGNTHAITVVYLNVPEELSVRQDAQRPRSVGPELIHQKLIDIHKTWDELIDEYKRIGIYKLVEMIDINNGKEKFPKWKAKTEYVNYDLIKSQH